MLTSFRRVLSRISGFAASTVILGLTALAVTPMVIHAAGATAWAAFAVGQAVGAIGAVFVGLGWTPLGPTLVAQAEDAHHRREIYGSSVRMRLGAMCVVAPVAALVAGVISPDRYATVSMIAAVGTSAATLGGGWFFVGLRSPTGLMLFDTLPRVTATLLGGVLAVVTSSALGAAIGVLVGSIAALGLTSAHIARTTPRNPGAPHRDGISLRSQLSGLGIGAFSLAYLYLPVLFVAAFMPADVAAYALADRIKQQGLTAVGPVSQAFQGTVAAVDDEQQRAARARQVFLAAIAFGTVAALTFALLGPAIGHVLGAGKVGFGYDMSIPFGLALGLNAMTLMISSSCLLTFRLAKPVMLSAAAGCVSILVLLATRTQSESAVTVAWCVAAAQFAVFGVQVAAHLANQRAVASRSAV